jgi:hypothetical protein
VKLCSNCGLLSKLFLRAIDNIDCYVLFSGKFLDLFDNFNVSRTIRKN